MEDYEEKGKGKQGRTKGDTLFFDGKTYLSHRTHAERNTFQFFLYMGGGGGLCPTREVVQIGKGAFTLGKKTSIHKCYCQSHGRLLGYGKKGL